MRSKGSGWLLPAASPLKVSLDYYDDAGAKTRRRRRSTLRQQGEFAAHKCKLDRVVHLISPWADRLLLMISYVLTQTMMLELMSRKTRLRNALLAIGLR